MEAVMALLTWKCIGLVGPATIEIIDQEDVRRCVYWPQVIAEIRRGREVRDLDGEIMTVDQADKGRLRKSA
jgi:hypothetical protein